MTRNLTIPRQHTSGGLVLCLGIKSGRHGASAFFPFAWESCLLVFPKSAYGRQRDIP